MAYNHAQGQPQGQYPASVVYYAAPQITYQPTVIKHYVYGQYYARETSTGLGATQIVLACLSVAAGVMAFVYGTHYCNIGIGIWAGPLYVIAGAIAIAAGKDPSTNLIISTLVFSVSDIFLGVSEITIASIGLAEDLYCYYNQPYPYQCANWYGPYIAPNSMMILVGSLEAIFGLWTMVISARAIDKGYKAQMTIGPITHAPHQPQRVFVQAPPAFQPQPPPYNAQQQYQSTSNPQQTIYAGARQAPSKTVKS